MEIFSHLLDALQALAGGLVLADGRLVNRGRKSRRQKDENQSICGAFAAFFPPGHDGGLGRRSEDDVFARGRGGHGRRLLLLQALFGGEVPRPI